MKSLTEFINEHQTDIDAFIRTQWASYGKSSYYSADNSERIVWILNDYTLLRWALVEGVQI